MIGFGDSFTSGEGNPERPALFFCAPWTGGNLPVRDRVSLRVKDTRAQWTDRRCHRSVYSWQIRTALDAALADPHQFFTILPHGCSGATITEGILYGYNGVEWSARTNKGVVGSRSEIGLAYQEICRPEASARIAPRGLSPNLTNCCAPEARSRSNPKQTIPRHTDQQRLHREQRQRRIGRSLLLSFAMISTPSDASDSVWREATTKTDDR